MAKSKETYNKKEKEKKRLKQLQEKREKMEVRKANKQKGIPLQDMMAYIDENGAMMEMKARGSWDMLRKRIVWTR